mmetsp:Transcript_60071/g.147684  ORF Transcript_60071/g.147684 Transcript_60071/m.147684 type:complete len:255 (+) Transcript_60071:28-792(+)
MPEEDVEEVVMAGTFASHPLDPRSGHAVICRANRPLLALRRELLLRGVKCNMLGRADLAEKLERLLERVVKTCVRARLTRVRLSSLLKGKIDDKKARDGENKDDLESLLHLAESCPDGIVGVEKVLRDLKNEKEHKDAVTLATIHKAKGLEWKRVYILQKTLKHDDADEREEQNCAYVAATRAQQQLVFLVDPNLWQRVSGDVSYLFELLAGAEEEAAPDGFPAVNYPAPIADVDDVDVKPKASQDDEPEYPDL